MDKLLPITYKLVMDDDGEGVSHVEICQGTQIIKIDFASSMMSGEHTYRWSIFKKKMDSLSELVHELAVKNIRKD